MKIPGAGELNPTHSGRYTGGQSRRASTKTGFIVSGEATKERVNGELTGYVGRDRLIDGMNWILSSRDCCFSGSAFNTDSPRWAVSRSAYLCDSWCVGWAGVSCVPRTPERVLVPFQTISHAGNDLTRSTARGLLSIVSRLSTPQTEQVGARYLGEPCSNIGPNHKLDPLDLRLGKHDTEMFVL